MDPGGVADAPGVFFVHRHSGERRNPGLDPGFRRGDDGLYRLSTDRKWSPTPIPLLGAEALEAFPGLFYERPAECDRATVVLDGAGPVLDD